MRLHPAECDRLDSLASYGVQHLSRRTAIDALTARAARSCGTPLAAVVMLGADHAWFTSMHGADLHSTERAGSFCAEVVADGAPLVVADAVADPHYRDLHAVVAMGVRAYAGVPLVGRDGLPLGALCVFDLQPHPFTDADVAELLELGQLVMVLLEQHRRDQAHGLLADGVLEEARDPVRLRQALDRGELVPHFQPLVDLQSGRPHGVEALLRWEHPERGTLSAASFLPAVEESALVVPVGRAALDAALEQAAELHRRGRPLPGGVAVNVASGQLARPGLAADVTAALDRHGVPAGQLSLEITEATALPDVELARTELEQLALAGVRIVIDDYGVGWSNLSRVLQLPVSALKLDRSIAASVLSDRRAAAMVVSTVRLADELGFDVVAEGVETAEVRAWFAGAGCTWAQGWYFSPAVPGRDLPEVLARLAAAAVRAAAPRAAAL